MKTQWFKRLGWFYLPVSLPGGIITLAALAFWSRSSLPLTGTHIRPATRFTASSRFSPARSCYSFGLPEEPAANRMEPALAATVKTEPTNFARWWTVIVFAIAMAWVESAVVFYLRTMIGRIEPYQPAPLPVIGGFALVELPRESATLVMLFAVGLLRAELAGADRLRRPRIRRVGHFLLCLPENDCVAGRIRCWIGTSCFCCRCRGGGRCSRRFDFAAHDFLGRIRHPI